MLNWTAPTSNGGAAITNYLIYQSYDGVNFILNQTLGVVLFYNVTGLSNGNTYYYIVEANNTAGIGANSTIVYQIPNPLVPSAPQNLVATGEILK